MEQEQATERSPYCEAHNLSAEYPKYCECCNGSTQAEGEREEPECTGTAVAYLQLPLQLTNDTSDIIMIL